MFLDKIHNLYTIEHYNEYFKEKVAFLDELFDPTFTINRLREAVGYKYTCHAMFPLEIHFSPYPVYYEFCTVLVERIQRVLIRLRESGWYTLLVKSERFFLDIHLRRFRKGLAKEDPQWLEHQRNLNRDRINSSMISFMNLNIMF